MEARDFTVEGIEMVSIAGDTFFMGATENDRFANRHELPRHEVKVKAFFVSKYLITEAQYSCLMGLEPTEPSLPAVNVSWEDAQKFCDRLSAKSNQSFRLPTEEEWEFIYRAGSELAFPEGDFTTLKEGNFLYDELGNRIGLGMRTKGGSYPLNAFGVGDLLGNATEWTATSWRTDYSEGVTEDSELKVIRGGGWDSIPRLLRCSNRDYAEPSHKTDNLGFRIILAQ